MKLAKAFMTNYLILPHLIALKIQSLSIIFFYFLMRFLMAVDRVCLPDFQWHEQNYVIRSF